MTEAKLANLKLKRVYDAPSDADLRAAAGRVLAALLAKDYPAIEAQFDEKMKAALPPGRLGMGWDIVALQAGPLKRCGNVRVRAIGDKQMVIHACEFERLPQIVSAPSVEFRRMVREGEQMLPKKRIEAKPRGVELCFALFESLLRGQHVGKAPSNLRVAA